MTIGERFSRVVEWIIKVLAPFLAEKDRKRIQRIRVPQARTVPQAPVRAASVPSPATPPIPPQPSSTSPTLNNGKQAQPVKKDAGSLMKKIVWRGVLLGVSVFLYFQLSAAANTLPTWATVLILVFVGLMFIAFVALLIFAISRSADDTSDPERRGRRASDGWIRTAWRSSADWRRTLGTALVVPVILIFLEWLAVAAFTYDFGKYWKSIWYSNSYLAAWISVHTAIFLLALLRTAGTPEARYARMAILALVAVTLVGPPIYSWWTGLRNRVAQSQIKLGGSSRPASQPVTMTRSALFRNPPSDVEQRYRQALQGKSEEEIQRMFAILQAESNYEQFWGHNPANGVVVNQKDEEGNPACAIGRAQIIPSTFYDYWTRSPFTYTQEEAFQLYRTDNGAAITLRDWCRDPKISVRAEGEAVNRGFNILTAEGNDAFGAALYIRDGATPWEPSRIRANGTGWAQLIGIAQEGEVRGTYLTIRREKLIAPPLSSNREYVFAYSGLVAEVQGKGVFCIQVTPIDRRYKIYVSKNATTPLGWSRVFGGLPQALSLKWPGEPLGDFSELAVASTTREPVQVTVHAKPMQGSCEGRWWEGI